MSWTALAALGNPEACNVAARGPRGAHRLLRVEAGRLVGWRPLGYFLPGDRQRVADQRRWVAAAVAKWDYEAFPTPEPVADTPEALAALVPLQYPGSP